MDNTDFQGRSELRVVTNSSAFNLAAVIQQMDKDFVIASTTASRIEIALKEK